MLECSHFRCRLDTASELLWLSRILNRPDIKQLIHKVLFELPSVRCRVVSRSNRGKEQGHYNRHNANAPLPTGDNT